MTRPISQILFTGDFLRPSPTVFRPTQHENIRWLAQLLGVPISMASGLPCQEVCWDNKWVNQPVFEKDTIASIYRCFWLEPSIRSWAQIYAAETLPAPVERLLESIFKDSLVVGFELPPVLMHFFKRHDIQFVDCALSPVRFMDDLVIGVSTSEPNAVEVLQGHGIPKGQKQLAAGVVSAHAAKAFNNPPRPNSLLVIMQTGFDKAVINGNHFVTLEDYLEDLEHVAKDYSHVLIKQHPIEVQPELCDQLINILPNASVTDENFYRLISHPNLKGVAALSSSCLHEAGFFGKRQHVLMPGVVFDKSSIGHEVIDVGDAILTPDFWRDVLGAAGLSVSPKDGLTLPPKPNRFRLQHRTAWGYNQIDTDIAVAWAKE